MLKLRINPIAQNDLMDIKTYLAEEINNPIAADNVINKIINKYEGLVEYPFIGSSLQTKMGIATDYRYLVCDSYLIFYKVDNEYVSI